MTCIITGCVLTDGYQWVGGDLHEVADAYVFNAITDSDRGVNWGTREMYAHYKKEVKIPEFGQFCEYRGVFVFPKKGATLNAAAQEYLS